MNEHYLVGDDALRLLIVEDEAPIRRGLLHHVNWQNLGIGEIQTAENADEALCLIADFRPDMIVSDIRMPGMDGTQMARIVKERLPDCQIFFISGYSDKEYLQAAISLGATSYVEKPINIEELEQVVRKAQKAIQKIRQNNETALHALIYHPQQTAEYGEENHWDHYVVFAVRVKEDTGIQLHEFRRNAAFVGRRKMERALPCYGRSDYIGELCCFPAETRLMDKRRTVAGVPTDFIDKRRRGTLVCRGGKRMVGKRTYF